MKHRTAYIVTVKRRTPRDYDVCWCWTLEEAREKFRSFFCDEESEGEIMSATIEELKDGKRRTISCLARA